MDRVDLMSVTPEETKAALGEEDETIGVIRGDRRNFKAASASQHSITSRKKRASETLQYSAGDYNPPNQRRIIKTKRRLWRRLLTRRRKPLYKVKQTQTDPKLYDPSKYVDTALWEELSDADVRSAYSRNINLKPRKRRKRRPFWRHIPIQRNKPLQFLMEHYEHIRADALHEDPESSSTYDMSSMAWSGDEVYEEEKDAEWVEDPTVDETKRDFITEAYVEKMKEADQKDAKPDLYPECTRTMRVLNTLFIPQRALGRMPFYMYRDNGVVNFELRAYSIPFILFCMSTLFLMLNTAMMALGFMAVTSRLTLTDKEHYSFYQKVENRVFDKYNYIAAVTFMYCLHASIASLALIFDEGHALANYMKRFNHLVVAIKYGPYDDVRGRILLQHAWIAGYAIIATLLFVVEMEDFMVVRGASDLIGFLVLVPFDVDLLFSHNFYNMRYYGFFLHLYAIFASHTLVMWPVTYAHVLENMARIWNLRMAHVFGMLSRPEGDGKITTYHTVIPYSRLLAEHIAITDLLRETGNAFTIGLGVYYMLKFFEMILLGYSLMSVLAFPFVTFDEKYINGLPEHLPKIAYTDTKVVVVLTSLYMVVQSMFGWFIISHWLTNCGYAIMSGFEFARRHAVILCEGTVQRKFIESLCCTFAPIGDLYMRATFTIDKTFIYQMFFWWAASLALLTAFSPLLLQKDLITFCNNGTCVQVGISRVSLNSQGGKKHIFTHPKNTSIAPFTPPAISSTITTQTTLSTTLIVKERDNCLNPKPGGFSGIRTAVVVPLDNDNFKVVCCYYRLCNSSSLEELRYCEQPNWAGGNLEDIFKDKTGKLDELKKNNVPYEFSECFCAREKTLESCYFIIT